MSDEILRLKNLTVDYEVKDGWLSAVKDLDLEINRGEIFALVGESGCGKSTVAHSILRLLNAENARVTGHIYFNGEDLNEVPDKRMEQIRGKGIGMIFQNPLDSLNPVFKVGSQVQEAIMLDKVEKNEAWQKTIDLFNEVRIPDASDRVNSYPHQLSGGMRQRVMIAMMISRNPELLICDEPTTALDVTIESQILEIIKRLRKEHNTAVLLITHNFGLVAEIADKIAVMYAGEIIEIGDVYQIFHNPQHPYTSLLMQALPRQTKAQGRLKTIEGTVPRIMNRKPGCRFCNRCPFALEKCETVTPPWVDIGNGHFSQCFLAEEGKDNE